MTLLHTRVQMQASWASAQVMVGGVGRVRSPLDSLDTLDDTEMDL
jgi:hypothetical protein